MTKYKTKYGKNKPETGKIWLSTGKIIQNTDPNQALTFVWRSGKSSRRPNKARISAKYGEKRLFNRRKVVFSNIRRLF